MPWDMDEYYVEVVKGKTDKNCLKYPNPNFGLHSEPLTVVDIKCHIVLWYLPGTIPVNEEVVFFSI